MEFKSINVPFQVKEIDEEKNIFEGYASTFRNEDFHGDVMEQGAFTKTIQERKDKVKVLWQHDAYNPIGKAIHMEEDNHGLYVKAQIFDTVLGRDAMTLIKGGVIDELSIGFRTIKDEWDSTNNVRRIKEVQLFEFSPVTFAANNQANITAAKSDELAAAIKKFNDELKAGKVLSSKNEDLVKSAISALQTLIDATEDPDKNKQTEQEVKDVLQLMAEMRDYK